MIQVYIATAFAFILIGLMAYLEDRQVSSASNIAPDADGRHWYISGGVSGLIGGEFIEE